MLYSKQVIKQKIKTINLNKQLTITWRLPGWVRGRWKAQRRFWRALAVSLETFRALGVHQSILISTFLSFALLFFCDSWKGIKGRDFPEVKRKELEERIEGKMNSNRMCICMWESMSRSGVEVCMTNSRGMKLRVREFCKLPSRSPCLSPTPGLVFRGRVGFGRACFKPVVLKPESTSESLGNFGKADSCPPMLEIWFRKLRAEPRNQDFPVQVSRWFWYTARIKNHSKVGLHGPGWKGRKTVTCWGCKKHYQMFVIYEMLVCISGKCVLLFLEECTVWILCSRGQDGREGGSLLPLSLYSGFCSVQWSW